MAPEAVRRHDLVELLELPSARDIGGPIAEVGLGEGEAAGPGIRGVVREFVGNELGFTRTPHDHHAEESLQHREEVPGLAAAQTVRSVTGADHGRIDVVRFAEGNLARSKDGLRRVEGAPLEEALRPWARSGVGELGDLPLARPCSADLPWRIRTTVSHVQLLALTAEGTPLRLSYQLCQGVGSLESRECKPVDSSVRPRSPSLGQRADLDGARTTGFADQCIPDSGVRCLGQPRRPRALQSEKEM